MQCWQADNPDDRVPNQKVFGNSFLCGSRNTTNNPTLDSSLRPEVSSNSPSHTA